MGVSKLRHRKVLFVANAFVGYMTPSTVANKLIG